MITGKTIFISPLDWGLGHATRCVPVIRGLLQNDNKILLGVTPLTEQVLTQEFPTLEKIRVPPYNIRYSSFLPLGVKLGLDAPRIFSVIQKENKLIERIVSDYQVDVIISDNRFGLYSKKVRSIFISHQLFLKAPFATVLAQKINRHYVLKFDEVWIPDYEAMSNSLSGELSHGVHFHPHVKYIGPQSRLLNYDQMDKKYDYLFLLSGPEPYKTVLKNLLLEKAKHYPQYKFVLVNSSDEIDYGNNLETFVSPDGRTLSKLICESKQVICSSGYSTLMDMYQLDVRNLTLIPTPGQTEQEYLAEFWAMSRNCRAVRQKDLDRLIL